MRKLLLATAALAVLGGPAMAATTTVTTTVPQSCTASIDPNVSLPADASAVTGNFSYTCNFTGNTADVTWKSTNGGVTDGATTHDYSITSSIGGSGVASIDHTESDVATTANVASPQTFTLQLLNPIIVAGTYTDTLAVTIAP
jgi:hypothetical protein